MILINPSSIHEHLARMNFTKPYELHCVPSIDSTNQFLNHLPLFIKLLFMHFEIFI